MKQLTWKQVGAFILLILGLVLAFSPVDQNSVEALTPEELAMQVVNREDHITAEQLGSLIIDEDPSYMLIDVRSPEEYENFHIKSAINVPLEKLFSSEGLEQLDRTKLLILYSNGGTHAAQAWIMLKQFGYKNALVLLGGLNYYVDVYSNPKAPEGVYADSEIFRYQFLKSAGEHLLGGNKTQTVEAPEVPEVQFQPVKKKRTKKADEGC